MAKRLNEITRREWVMYNWVCVGSYDNPDAYVKGTRRYIDEHEQAGREWDEWHKNYDEEIKSAE